MEKNLILLNSIYMTNAGNTLYISINQYFLNNILIDASYLQKLELIIRF